MRNIAMIVSYDGTAYRGFQVQPRGRTIQGELEKAIGKLTSEDVRVEGSGRTDAGVHAYGQVVSFRTESAIPIERVALAVNSRLPDDIVVRSSHEMPPDFHARKSAIRKTYRYSASTGKYPDVFTRRYRYHHYNPLDESAMREALRHFVGTYDFSSFTSAGSTKRCHVRTIYDARLERDGGDIHIWLTGSGFLYNMVRIISGTLFRIGEGKWPPDVIPDIIAAKDRAKAGPKAEAHGLTMWRVEYPEPYDGLLAFDPSVLADRI